MNNRSPHLESMSPFSPPTIAARTVVVLCVLVLVSPRLRSQSADVIQMRINDVQTLLSKKPLDADTVFTKDFLTQVPKPRLTMGVAQLMVGAGTPISSRIVAQQGTGSFTLEYTTDSNFVVPVDLTIDAQPPHRIVGLLIKPRSRLYTTFSELETAVRKLDGESSLCVVDLTSNKAVAAVNPDTRFPIGSTFKLFILGEVLRQIQAGTLRWDDVVTLDSTTYSLPSGILHTWPHGAPITIHTLASKMISVSDNTATDILLHKVGRENVENVQGAMGHQHPEWNVPFLGTREMFLLKFINQGTPGREYAAGNVEARRRYLQEKVTRLSTNDVVLTASPILTDSVEWFATTRELCSVMQWFRNTDTTGRATQFGVLGINRGLPIPKETFPGAYYKGGSEAGVINMTYLVRRKDGRWFAVSCSQHDTSAALDEDAYTAIVGSVFRLLERY